MQFLIVICPSLCYFQGLPVPLFPEQWYQFCCRFCHLLHPGLYVLRAERAHLRSGWIWLVFLWLFILLGILSSGRLSETCSLAKSFYFYRFTMVELYCKTKDMSQNRWQTWNDGFFQPLNGLYGFNDIDYMVLSKTFISFTCARMINNGIFNEENDI